MTNEKHFPKNVSQWEFDYGLFTNLPETIVHHYFSPSSFKLKRGILPPLKNAYPKMKTTSHKLKSFLVTKLIENLLLAEYVTSYCAFKSSIHAIHTDNVDFNDLEDIQLLRFLLIGIIQQPDTIDHWWLKYKVMHLQLAILVKITASEVSSWVIYWTK